MTTDKELLTLAAKSRGIELLFDALGYVYAEGGKFKFWNPLEEDGDAHRLAVYHEINIRHDAWCVTAERFLLPDCQITEHLTMGYGREEATRRAIVRAAVEIWEKRQ